MILEISTSYDAVNQEDLKHKPFIQQNKYLKSGLV